MSQGIDEGTKSHKPRAQRVKFSQSEDELLKSLVQQSENPDWKMIATFFKNRNGRQCRERWKHYLSISPVDKKWTFEEDQQLFLEVQQFGTKWTQLVKYHPGRSDLQLRAQYHKILEQSPDGHMFQKPLLQTQMTPVDMNSSINPALVSQLQYPIIISQPPIVQNSTSQNGLILPPVPPYSVYLPYPVYIPPSQYIPPEDKEKT